jgi:hypothetical protein
MKPWRMNLCACSSFLLHILMLKFVRWDDEAVTHDLCECMMASSTLVTHWDLMNISGDVRLYAWYESRTTEWIFMTFVMDVVPFEANRNHNYYFPTFGNAILKDSKVTRWTLTTPLHIIL